MLSCRIMKPCPKSFRSWSDHRKAGLPTAFDMSVDETFPCLSLLRSLVIFQRTSELLVIRSSCFELTRKFWFLHVFEALTLRDQCQLVCEQNFLFFVDFCLRKACHKHKCRIMFSCINQLSLKRRCNVREIHWNYLPLFDSCIFMTTSRACQSSPLHPLGPLTEAASSRIAATTSCDSSTCRSPQLTGLTQLRWWAFLCLMFCFSSLRKKWRVSE